ncbi:MC25A protein, partial [Polyodon spathula]|nr:MC25A protein [Polyodon spathula]
MGGSESTSRKVSFGLDEDDRVRVLHGIKLSEDVVKRMKESSGQSKPSFSDHGSSHRETGSSPSSTGPKPPSEESSGKKITEREEELYKRYEREQALVQEELARIAKRERVAGQESLTLAVMRERAQAIEEKQKTKVMVLQALFFSLLIVPFFPGRCCAEKAACNGFGFMRHIPGVVKRSELQMAF